MASNRTFQVGSIRLMTHNFHNVHADSYIPLEAQNYR